MTNVTEETVTLARHLWNIFDEAYPSAAITWDDLARYEREAWVQVAQFVDTQIKKATDIMCADCYETFRTQEPDHKL
jgi:hypothetical protein